MASTDTTSATKTLIYDGDCPMCRATIAWLVSWRLVRPEQTVSNHELTPEELAAAHAAGLRNELVALDPQTGETRRGADGLLWIIRSNRRHRLLVGLLSLPGFRHLMSFGYQTIAYNRRIISPPASRMVCDCEPEVTLGRRLSLVVPCVLASVAIWSCAGAALFAAADMGSPQAGATYLATLGISSQLLLAIATYLLMPRDKRLDLLAHGSFTTLSASLVFVPAIAIALVAPHAVTLVAFALSAVASLTLFVSMLSRRLK